MLSIGYGRRGTGVRDSVRVILGLELGLRVRIIEE